MAHRARRQLRVKGIEITRLVRALGQPSWTTPKGSWPARLRTSYRARFTAGSAEEGEEYG
jgi:hypothetical protein